MSESIFKNLNLLDFFGIFVGVVVLIFGLVRISSGTGYIDEYTAHYVRVGWMYLIFSLLILGFFAIKISSLLKKK